MVSIPVPPFRDARDADTFLRLVLLRVRRLGDHTAVAFPELLLGQALQLHRPVAAGERDTASFRVRCCLCATPHPCRTVLVVAAAVRLPAPWTPESLAQALAAAGWDYVVGDGTVSWGDDPTFLARRGPGGRWTLTRNERGRVDVLLADGAEHEVCDVMQEGLHSHSFPFGWKVPDGWEDLVAAGLEEERVRWQAHLRLPYVVEHEPRPSA